MGNRPTQNVWTVKIVRLTEVSSVMWSWGKEILSSYYACLEDGAMYNIPSKIMIFAHPC